MRRSFLAIIVLTFWLAGGCAWRAGGVIPGGGAAYPDPTRFEKAILDYETRDRQAPPPAGAIVAVGSSSMLAWHPTIRKDLAPLTIIPRGFGGSNMREALYYADRIVIAYRPRAILVYEGDNDIAQGFSPEKIGDTFRAFVARVHKRLPRARIYVISIKPSIARWALWPQMRQANALLAAVCAADPRLTYIDAAGPMLGADGRPRPEIFKPDKLHMNPAGYGIWRAIIRPVLLYGELAREPAVPLY